MGIDSSFFFPVDTVRWMLGGYVIQWPDKLRECVSGTITGGGYVLYHSGICESEVWEKENFGVVLFEDKSS